MFTRRCRWWRSIRGGVTRDRRPSLVSGKSARQTAHKGSQLHDVPVFSAPRFAGNAISEPPCPGGFPVGPALLGPWRPPCDRHQAGIPWSVYPTRDYWICFFAPPRQGKLVLPHELTRWDHCNMLSCQTSDPGPQQYPLARSKDAVWIARPSACKLILHMFPQELTLCLVLDHETKVRQG